MCIRDCAIGGGPQRMRVFTRERLCTLRGVGNLITQILIAPALYYQQILYIGHIE